MLGDWRVGRRSQNLAGRSFWEQSEQNFLNSLGNTDEKYLPYAVLKVQKITIFTKDNKDTKEIENQLVMTAGFLSV